MGDIEYNEDELNAPEWMNSEFFQKILRNANKDDSIEVKELTMKPGSAKGDHYGSVMFRAVINYDTKDSKGLKKSLIIKTMPFVEGNKKEMLESMNIFETEIKMYNNVLPEIQKELKAIGDDSELCCRCLYAANEPQELLVFEDLTVRGFKTVSNLGGSWEVGKKAIEKLAKMHALSFKRVSEGDKYLQTFNKSAFTDDKLLETPMFKNGFRDFLEMLKADPELQIYVPKFEKLSAENPIQKAQNLHKAYLNGDKANLFVLNHGDFHIKNLMFTETKDGKVDDVLLVDFQICIWGPAALDLIYLLYMIVDEDSRIHRRNEIIHFYFEIFTDTLKKAGFTGEYPRLCDLYKDFITYKDFEIFILTTLLPFVTALMENPLIDMDQAMHGDDVKKNFYKNEKYKNHVKQVLPRMLYKGYLD